MPELFYKIFFVVLWLIYVLIRVPHDKHYKNVSKEKTKRLFVEKTLVLINFIGMVLLTFIWLFTPWLNNFNLALHASIRLTGGLLMAFSLIFFWWVHKILGANWSPVLEIRQGHELIKSGPYKYIRHPMYTQIWLWVIAQSLLISNSFVALGGILAWTIVYFSRVRVEEKMMKEKFGHQYEVYMKQTWRIFPKLF